MKLLLIVLLLPALALAKGTQITGTGGAPIPTAYDATNAKSQVQECQGNVIEILNQTAAVVAFGFGSVTAVPAFDYAFVPPGANSGGRFKPKGGMDSKQYVYIRSAGSALTSLTVQVSCYYEEKP